MQIGFNGSVNQQIWIPSMGEVKCTYSLCLGQSDLFLNLEHSMPEAWTLTLKPLQFQDHPSSLNDLNNLHIPTNS